MPQSCLKDDIFTPHQYGTTMTGHTYGFSHPCSLVSLAVTLSGIIPASSEIPCCASKGLLLNIVSNSNNSFQKVPGLKTHPNAALGGSHRWLSCGFNWWTWPKGPSLVKLAWVPDTLKLCMGERCYLNSVVTSKSLSCIALHCMAPKPHFDSFGNVKLCGNDPL